MNLVQHVVALRRAFNQLVSRRLAQETEHSFLQLLMLKYVAEGKATTQAQVADLLVVDPAAVCRLADRLEEEGLLARCKGKDRRCVRLEVTPAARPLVATLEAHLEWLDVQARKHLTEREVETLIRLLGKVQAGLAESTEPRGVAADVPRP